ncbi:hypothetical protein BDW59DRAFT_179572 [Aspergillus cavernicola]|uniref:NAD(P)-binding protein n=1 Tax=Aspergillus cavernicola TaxID=176166 RepID=A0ABR4IFE0_9EURO
MRVESPPSTWWCQWNALKGTGGTILTETDVSPRDLTGKWIIITGSNNGIGFEAAKAFARFGANLILACRDPPAWEQHPDAAVEECKAAAQSSGHSTTVEWWEIDMADLSSIDAFAQRWLATQRPLDILCNNAGISPPAMIVMTKDGFELTHQINFLSHVLLTLRLLDSLARSPEPRIVCTTSCYHFLGKYDLDHFNTEPGMIGDPYGNNKLYYQMWIVELQRRLLLNEGYKHITVNGLHPGYVNSGIWNNQRPDAGSSWRFPILKFIASWLAISVEQGSLAIVYAATNLECGPDPEVQGVGAVGGSGGGHYFNRIWKTEPMPYCRDEVARLEVWERVGKELGLREKGLDTLI